MTLSVISQQILFILLVCDIQHVSSMGRVISDWRIQNKDVTPVLGRGYSVATGNLQSSCLKVTEQTTASYDYDYYFTEIKNDGEKNINKSFTGKISSSFGFMWAKSHIDNSLETNINSKTKKHFIIATMRTQRYYASVDEVHSELSDDAKTLLENGQFLSFFQACGPNYIRSVRRAAEITAIFEYENTEDTANANFEKSIKMSIQGLADGHGPGDKDSTASRKLMSNSLRNSLTISIRAFGLGLEPGGESSLQARNIEDFKNVMDFAFQSMQQPGVGMVQGIEIVAWVDNPQFQVAAKLSDTLQECEQEEDTVQSGRRSSSREAATTAKPESCKTISMEIKKMNLSSNAEYVTTMNRVMRMHIDSLYNVQLCRSILNEYSNEDDDEKLMNHRKFRDTVDDKGNENTSSVTIGELKALLDVKSVQEGEKRIQNYSKYFYSPCMDALSNDVGGQKGGTSMTKPWYTLEACRESTCTISGAVIDSSGNCSIEKPDRVMIAVEQYCNPTLANDV